MNSEQKSAGDKADALIAIEVAIQDAMWGDANERADSTKNQLMDASLAQQVLLKTKLEGSSVENATELAREFYPTGWEGLRDYGSNIANLVVATAFLRSEIKRRLLLGEDTTRTKRGEAYTIASPYMTSEQAAATLQ